MTQGKQHPDPDHSRVLAKIYDEYDGFIRSVIRFSAHNAADREDIYQEVFVVLFQKTDLEDIQEFKSYLYRLVINKSRQFLRKKLSGENQFRKYMERTRVPEVQDDEALEDMMLTEELDGMMDMIQEHLSRKEAQALRLRFHEHYEIDEAAREMNVRRQTLIRYVSVGLKKLREIIKSRSRAED